MTAHELEKIIIQEALDLKKEEAFSICILDEQILSKKSFPEMLATILAQQLGGDLVSKVDLEKLFLNQFNLFPSIIDDAIRSEEHTSELQSRPHLVCRLLLE